jgi:hypothetical protein
MEYGKEPEMAEQENSTGQAPQDWGLVSRIGPLKVDWPRSIGYYGGIGVALTAGMIEPPLAIFIAAIPLIKLLNRPGAPVAQRVVGQLLDGAAKPVGGSSEATIELATTGGATARQPARPSIWQEARQLADRRVGRAT